MRRRSFVALAGLLALALAPAPAEPVAVAQAGKDEAAIALPLSFGQVWFRPGPKSGLAGGKQTGLLTVSENGIEFSAKKQSHILPWSRIEMISYGRMSGDPDTMWVVLSLTPVAGEWSRIGVRDGSKMGYGGGTSAIFDAIVAGSRQVGAGPFAAPQGFSAHFNSTLDFSLAVPNDWHPYSVSETYVDGRSLWGRTIFSPLDLTSIRADDARLKQALTSIRNGMDRAVFFDRFEADGGFTCRKLGKSGRRELSNRIDAGLKPLKLVSEPQWTEHAHRYCMAWTFAGRATTKDGTTIDVRFYAVSDGQTAYLLGARGSGNDHFEQVARSLKTAVGR